MAKISSESASTIMCGSSAISIWTGYAKEIGGNGGTGDQRSTLCIAPAVDADYDEVVYYTTAGDPVLVACADDGVIEWSGDYLAAVNGPEQWVADALEQAGFELAEAE